MKKWGKKLLCLLLCTVMIAGLLPGTMSLARAEGKTITGLGTGAITNPAGSGSWSYVYFGKYNGNPVKYRVLSKNTNGFGGTTMLLDCNSTLLTKRFDDDSTVWANSEIRGWLNGDGFLGNTSCFTSAENAAIAVSSKDAPNDDDGSGWSSLGFAKLSEGDKKDRIFLLDAREATCSTYGYTDWGNEDNYNWADDSRKKSGADTWWWLRSPYSNSGYYAGSVDNFGSLSGIYVGSEDVSVSPALNINLSSVIFSSLISGTAGEAGAEYRLTLLDSDMTIGVSSAGVSRSGNVITVPYTVGGDHAGNKTQVSVVVTDGKWVTDTGDLDSSVTLIDYGKLSSSNTFTLPSGYSDSYHTYIIAEDVNGEKETDYASAPLEITIPHIHSFTYTANDNDKTITATCTAGCPDGYYTNGITLKLVLAPPDELGYYENPSTTGRYTYDSIPKECTLSGYPDPAPEGLAPAPTICYNTGGPPANVSNTLYSNDYEAWITWGTASVTVGMRIDKANITIVPKVQTVELNGTVSSTGDDVEYIGTLFKNDKCTGIHIEGDTSAVTDNGTLEIFSGSARIVHVDTGADTSGNYNITYGGSENYNSGGYTNPGKLIVTATTPVLADGTLTASAIIYGQTLENSAISGTMRDKNKDTIEVAGTFTWKTPTTVPTVTDSDSTEYEWTFTPDNTTNYNSATGKLKVKVNPNTTAIAITSADHSWTYDGTNHTDETYTVTYGNENIAADATGKVFTLPTGDNVTITPTAAGVTDCADSAVNNNTFTYALDHSEYYNHNVSTTFGTLTVNKADNPATVTGTATVMRGGNTVDLKDNVTLNDATGAVSYEISGEANGCTLNGSILTSGANTGSVTVNVTVAADDNYNALAATPMAVTITDKNTQTITAADVTATYGDTNKSVSATVTDPATGGGAISYAVKAGSEDYIDVDASTGALTIKKVPADGKAYVIVTAAETATYAGATKEVTVTISKALQEAPAAPTAANVTENSITLAATDGYEYRIDGTNWQDSPVFTGLNHNTEYTFYQRVAGDANHEPSPASQGTAITTGSIIYTVSESKGTEHTVGSGEDAVYTVKRNVNDADETFKNYTGATVDGNAIPDGGSTAESGSLILTLKSNYLNTLSVGDHKVKISFADGMVEAPLKIKAATPTPSPTPVPTPSPTPHPVPQTGDNDNPVLWIGLILLGIVGLAVLGVMKASRKRK